MPTAVYEKRSLTLDDAVADIKDYVDVSVEERTDELARMTQGEFVQIGKRFGTLETKIDEGFAGVDRRFGEVYEKFGEIDKRFDKLENLIIERTK